MSNPPEQFSDGNLLMKVLEFTCEGALEESDRFAPVDLAHYNQIQLHCLRMRMRLLGKERCTELSEAERYEFINGEQFSQRFRAFYVHKFPEKVTRL